MLLTTASPSCRNLYYRKRNLWAKSRYLLGALELFAQGYYEPDLVEERVRRRTVVEGWLEDELYSDDHIGGFSSSDEE